MSTATISCSTPEAIIRYEIGGADPTESSPLYSSPVDFTGEIRAKAWKNGMLESDIAVAVSEEEEMYYKVYEADAVPKFVFDSDLATYINSNRFLNLNFRLAVENQSSLDLIEYQLGFIRTESVGSAYSHTFNFFQLIYTSDNGSTFELYDPYTDYITFNTNGNNGNAIISNYSGGFNFYLSVWGNIN